MRNRYFLLLDLLLLAPLPFIVVALRMESLQWSPALVQATLVYAALALPVRMAVAYFSELYRFIWRHASLVELERLLFAGAIAGVLTFMLGAVFIQAFGLSEMRMPYSALVFDAILAMGAFTAPRLGVRMLSRGPRSRPVNARRVLIAGAGALGQGILREMRLSSLAIEAVGFVDDDPTKHQKVMGGVPVLGCLDNLPALIADHAVDEVIIAIPAARGTVVRRIVQAASAAGIGTRIVPGMGDLISGKVLTQSLRKVEIEDLLRRDPISTDLTAVRGLARDRCVLVTGAGGSIGSELCRQLCELGPSRLVALDHSENQVFEIHAELVRRFPNVEIVPVIADIRNEARLRHVFEQHLPFGVFHAAAHKHVPLMEENIVEAVTNNVMGTRNVTDAALDFDVQHLVFISTDKAVRPTSIMGATKRIAERVVHHAATHSGRNFVAVRFGNVLGSRGSVIPSFLRQIREGGPVTVTHPEMRRFFMTIPEAVQLVLQASALGKGGELFFLDMGESVKIVDLARDLIRLSGLEEGADIDITFTGIRPGEKLYEEVLFGHEDLHTTGHPKVLRVDSDETGAEVLARIDTLVQTVVSSPQSDQTLRSMLLALVPDFGADGARARDGTPAEGTERTAERAAVVRPKVV